MKKRVGEIIAIIMCLSCVLGCLSGCSTSEPVPYVVTYGTELVNSITGETVVLMGVNAGGWLVREGWMCPIADGTSEYTDIVMINTLIERFGRDKAYELIDIYENNWWTEADFDRVKSLGFNHIRLNFAYYNFYNLDDGTLRENAFEKIDWFISECEKREIYVVLDLHGAFGSQNGRHHSGNNTQATLFTDEENMQKTEDLWVMIASRYKENPWILGYDLLNEPEGDYQSGNTDEREWNYFDRLYKAIREVDPNHIIIMESCWEFTNLPKPETYGWTNVMYEIHTYNWSRQANSLFWGLKDIYYKAIEGTTPIYVGEFNNFGNAEDWAYCMDHFTNRGYSWAMWSYKATGYNSSWGVYCGSDVKVDVSTATEQEIRDAFSKVKTDEDNRYTLNTFITDALAPYLSKQNEN